MMRSALVTLFVLTLMANGVRAAGNPAEGRRLMEEHHCEACHHGKILGDAPAIYLRKDRKVTSLDKLKAQVARCNSQLNLKLFPDDEEHISAYLNETYYKFKP
ncbi:MAG TPA: hypothetical protein VN878_05395 [Usitatibacter sp.]|nr:hypothetical protein [Usitatibacter sp.]